MSKISVVLATYNEQDNLRECLESVEGLADEIVVVDGNSTDNTIEIAKKFGAKFEVTKNHPIFHINKQRAMELAKNEWILQLDADERVTKKLSDEILKVTNMDDKAIDEYQNKLNERKLFLKHQFLVEKRDGKAGDDSQDYAAFFIPRLNFFLGKYLKHGGVYPDGVIRLVKKGKAKFPCKSVHEQIEVFGKVGWLGSPLLHKDSPTFARYLERNSRYIDLMVSDFKRDNLKKDFIHFLKFVVVMPVYWFMLTQIRHKGILDGIQGIIFSSYSALRFARAYIRYIKD